MANKKVQSITWTAVLLFTVILYVFLYAFVHESGHALVGMAFGQKLQAFRVNIFTLNAYVSMSGSLTSSQRVLQSISGHGLAIVVWAVFMLLVPRRGDVVLRLLKAASTISMLASTFVWVLIPYLYLQGNAPPGDDVTHALNASGMPPLLLSGIALVVMAFMGMLAAYKNQGLKNDVIRAIELRKQGILDQYMASRLGGSRKTLVALGGLGLTFSLLLVGMQLVLPGKGSPGQPASIPPGYQLAAVVKLPEAAHSGEVVAELSLSQSAQAGVFVQIKDINTLLFELALEGPNDFRQLIIRAEGYSATIDTARYEDTLPAGTYRVVLTNQPSPGTLEVYLLEP